MIEGFIPKGTRIVFIKDVPWSGQVVGDEGALELSSPDGHDIWLKMDHPAIFSSLCMGRHAVTLAGIPMFDVVE